MITDNTTTFKDKDKSDDSGYTASLLSPRLADFEIQECKTEPCISRTNSTEDLSTLDESSILHIPCIPVITIRNPIVVLERCDKIWKTLQLIKTIQTDKPSAEIDESNEEREGGGEGDGGEREGEGGEEEEEEREGGEGEEEGEGEGGGEEEEEQQEEEGEKEEQEDEENEEEEQVQLNKIEPSASYKMKNESILKHNNAIALPFKFSVRSTKKVYPCPTCGKQYMERRSLRKHSERVHGIILPLQRKRTLKKSLERNNKVHNKEANPVVLSIKKENCEKKLDDKNSSVKMITEAKLAANNIQVSAKEYAISKYIKCILCQRKVKSLREHLIHYHKIGGSTNIVKLESSLLNENKVSPKTPSLPSSSKASPGNRRTTLRDILSGKPPQKFPNENTNETRDKSRVINNEGGTDRAAQVRRKRKYTLSYVKANKKLKLNNERYVPIGKTTTIVSSPRKKSINLITYKCDICLGTYASAHGLYKHRRVHKLRGETKENFHKFQCRYLNSPLNKKRLLNSSINASRARNANDDVNENVQLNNSRYTIKQNRNASMTDRAARYNERIDGSKPTCLCGKTFRHSHTLFVHKKKCKLCRQENKITEHTANLSSDKDSGIGINITIKKREDGYEIVGKDSDDETPQKSLHQLKDDTLSPNVLSWKEFGKSATNATKVLKQQQEVNAESKYSKDHSILKLQIGNEDEIIDIEDELQTDPDKSDKAKQVAQQVNEQNGDVKSVQQGEKVLDKVFTLTEMCQKVLDQTRDTCTNAVENKYQEKSHEKSMKNQEIDQENIEILGQGLNYKNKRELRSSNKRQRNMDKEFDYSFGETCTTKSDSSLACGYCNEQFNSSNSYNNHQCTVEEGKSFDEFSLQLLCSYCNETLSNYAEFDQHVQFEHFDQAFNCYQCTERFGSDKARLRHFHADHNDMRCRFCSKKLSVSLKILHEGYHLGFGYPCHKCKKAYTNKKNLSYHKYTIHPIGADNLITCSLCLKPVKLKSFRGHMSTHKHNACHFCGKVFSNRTGIEYHTMIHHGTNSKLKCNVCGTRFFTKKQLERHEKMDGCNNDTREKKDTAIRVKAH